MTARVPRRGNGRCQTCGGPADGFRADYCATHRQYGPGVPFFEVVAELERLAAVGLTQEQAAAELGTTAAALARRLYRRGWPDLGRWMARSYQDELNAAHRRQRTARQENAA